MRRFIFVLLIVLFTSPLYPPLEGGKAAAQVPYRIRLSDSTYTAQLRGVVGTRTASEAVNGAWSTTYKLHEFDVTVTGRYQLYVDPAGGTSYVLVSSWGKTNGKHIPGYDQATFWENISDSTNQLLSTGIGDTSVATAKLKADAVTTVKITDSTVTMPKLSTTVHAAMGDYGAGTYPPDDVTLAFQIAGSDTNIKIKDSWVTCFRSDVSDSVKDAIKQTYYASNYATIDACVSAAGANESMVIVDGHTYNISGVSLTIPDNVDLKILRGGLIDAASSKDLNINGTFDAGVYQCFGDSVTVYFDTAAVAVAYPNWWPLSADSTDYNAFNKMWDALPDGRKGYIKLVGDYYFKDGAWEIHEGINDSIGTQAFLIDGYGSAIWSEADTTIRVNLGYIGQSELLHRFEGLRLFGNGHDGSGDDRDMGTNVGIKVIDTGFLSIENCVIRNFGIGIYVSHRGPGWQAPFCDGLRIHQNMILASSGIVFAQDDTDNPGTYANFDNSVIEGNRIFSTSNDSLDACIKLGDYVIMSRSSFVNNMLWPYNEASAFYFGGGLGGSNIRAWIEGGFKYIFYISPTWKNILTTPTTNWAPYNIVVTHKSGTIEAEVLNLSNYRFIYKTTVLSEGFGGYAFRDWTQNVPPMQLKTSSATGGFMQGSTLMYNFQNIASNDTLVTDVSGNWNDLCINRGTSISSISTTEWNTLSFDGIDDVATTSSYRSNGDRMYIVAIIPDSAYTSATEQRVFKWFDGSNDFVVLAYASGSNQSYFQVKTSTGTSTIDVSETFSANTPLVFGCVIDSINSVMELWLNGHITEDATALIGDVGITAGGCAIGAEWGGASLFSALDIAFFAIYPYVNRQVLQEVSKSCLGILGGENQDLTVIDDLIVEDNASVGGDLTVIGDFILTGHKNSQEFLANAFQYPAPGTDWTPGRSCAGLGASKVTKRVFIPFNFLKIGDEIVSYKLVGDVTEANGVTLDCQLFAVVKTDPISTTPVAGGAIAQVNTDGNFDVEAVLSSTEVVATDKQYLLEVTATTGAAPDAIVVIGAEVKVNRK